MKLYKKTQITLVVGLIMLTFSGNALAQHQQADSIIRILHSSAHDSIKSTACYELGDFIYATDSIAEIYFEKVKKIVEKKNNNYLRFAERLMLSRYASNRGLARKELQLAREAEKLDNGTQFPEMRLRVFLHKAYAFTALGDYEKTYQNYLKALRIARESNDIRNESGILFSIGNMYSKQGLNDEALKMFTAQLEDSLRTPKHMLSGIYMMLGNVHWGMGNHELASMNWRAGIQHSFSVEHRVQMTRRASCFHNLGYWYMKQNKVDSALYVCGKALEIRNEIKDTRGIISSHSRFGEMYTELKNYPRAEEHLLIALSYLTEDTYLKKKVNLYLALARNYSAMKKHEKAEEYYEKHLEAHDKFVNESNIEQITTLKKDFEFETERKEKDVALKKSREELEIRKQRNQWLLIGGCIILVFAILGLIAYLTIRKSKKKIAIQKLKLEQSVKDKELLLKEVHHRVKNNLQVVNGLLQIQSNRSNNKEVKDILEQSQGRIFSISVIHELLYNDPDDQSVDASDYIDQLIQQNFKIQGGSCSFDSTTGGISLTMDDAIPLGLILNEMITNSFKHGFVPEKEGEISIELKALCTEEYQYSFSYKDNGKGFDKKILDPKRKSLGLRIIDLMTEQMDGKLKLDSSNGINYTLLF